MGGGNTLPAYLRVGVGNIVLLRQALGDDIGILHLIVISQSYLPLFQLAPAFRPDIGAAVLLIAYEGAPQLQAGDFFPFGGQLHIDMLTQHQPLGGVQIDVEGVPAGVAHLIHIAVHIVGIALGGAFVVHHGHGAQPAETFVQTGNRPNPIPGLNAAPLQLPQHRLDAVSAGFLDGDVGHRLAIVVGAAFADALHPAGNRGHHIGVFQQVLRLLHLGLLGLDLDLRLLQIQLIGLNLNGILQLCRAGNSGAFLLQTGDLLLIVGDIGLKLFQLQPLLVQTQLELLGIIGKEDLTFLHIVSLFYQQFLDSFVLVLLNLGDILRHHHTRKPVSGGDTPHGSQILHGLDIDTFSAVFTAAQCQQQCRQNQCHCFF